MNTTLILNSEIVQRFAETHDTKVVKVDHTSYQLKGTYPNRSIVARVKLGACPIIESITFENEEDLNKELNDDPLASIF